jgi:hypothetical protein
MFAQPIRFCNGLKNHVFVGLLAILSLLQPIDSVFAADLIKPLQGTWRDPGFIFIGQGEKLIRTLSITGSNFELTYEMFDSTDNKVAALRQDMTGTIKGAPSSAHSKITNLEMTVKQYGVTAARNSAFITALKGATCLKPGVRFDVLAQDCGVFTDVRKTHTLYFAAVLLGTDGLMLGMSQAIPAKPELRTPLLPATPMKKINAKK